MKLKFIADSRQEGKPGPQDPSQEVFLAFGRVFSGVLKDGQAMHVLSAAYNPAQPHLQRQIHHVSVILVSDNPISVQEIQSDSISHFFFGFVRHRQTAHVLATVDAVITATTAAAAAAAPVAVCYSEANRMLLGSAACSFLALPCCCCSLNFSTVCLWREPCLPIFGHLLSQHQMLVDFLASCL